MTGQEARDDEREALIAEATRPMSDLDVITNPPFTRAFIRRLGLALESAQTEIVRTRKHPEPEAEYVRAGVCLLCGDGVMNDGSHIDPERHVEEVERIVTGRKHPEPEWEYGAGYEADNGLEMRWFSMGGAAYTVREAAENEVARFDDPQIQLIRRTRPGPWVPVEEGEQ
ncbi:hypothetical protein [Microbacterium sp. NPDC080220]|uniref:hypothetical protein n=1 Tax=Microbacterium sp. NPDC080220 TaxID=3161017 RepID=UPI0034411DAD